MTAKENDIAAGSIMPRGCIITVGSFDGVHKGHISLLSALKREAEEAGLPAVVITFAENDRPKSAFPLIASRDEKLALLRAQGADEIFEFGFDEIRGISAKDFVRELLIRGFNARGVVCGYDFRFGAGRTGDSETLRSLLGGRAKLTVCPPVKIGGTTVSSTHIRSLIAGGRAAEAAKFLGRRFSVSGNVAHGRRIGASIGFPTINFAFPEGIVQPRFGVYAAVCSIGGKEYEGIADIGVKPTVGGTGKPVCETHLFGFSGDVYGMPASVSLAAFIRDERDFGDIASLGEQIGRDVLIAREKFTKGEMTDEI